MTGRKHDRTPRIGANPRGVVLGTLAFGFGLPFLLFSAVLLLSPVSRPEMMIALVKRLGERLGTGWNPDTWSATGHQLLYGASTAVLAFVLVTFGAVVSGMTVWWEMRVSSRMQSRVGYNRVGAGGAFQWIADAVKLILRRI